MVDNVKSILIDKDIHKKLKEHSKKSGLKMKNMVENAIERYLRNLKFPDEE